MCLYHCDIRINLSLCLSIYLYLSLPLLLNPFSCFPPFLSRPSKIWTTRACNKSGSRGEQSCKSAPACALAASRCRDLCLYKYLFKSRCACPQALSIASIRPHFHELDEASLPPERHKLTREIHISEGTIEHLPAPACCRQWLWYIYYVHEILLSSSCLHAYSYAYEHTNTN